MMFLFFELTARFAFCKTEEALAEADVRLKKLGSSFRN